MKIYCDSSTTEACIVIEGQDPIIIPYSAPVTNNVGEYQAVLKALSLALDGREPFPITILTDSKLVVAQGNRRWEVKKSHLLPFRDRVSAWLRDFPEITLVWVPREENLAGRVLDGR